MIQLRVQAETLDIFPEIVREMDDVAEAVPETFRRGVDADKPRGRLYRRGAITARATKGGLASGLKARGKTRMVSGSSFYRASAPDQFPAKDSGALYNRIKIEKKGLFERRVIFQAPHAGFVEEKRPFMDKTIELVVQRFL